MSATCFRPPPKSRWVTQEGYLYIWISLLLTFLAFFNFGMRWGFPFVLLTLYLIWFFRNPKRAIPSEKELIVAPADGKVLSIEETEESRYLNEKTKRISIFMSPFNCHMNRAPISAKVIDCFYREGSFHAAFKPKSVEHNEHHAILLEDERGGHWLVVQIAGWLARRIVSYVKGGEWLTKGERFGLIQFGSRTDLYCPLSCEILVRPGQKVYGGKTILGRIA